MLTREQEGLEEESLDIIGASRLSRWKDLDRDCDTTQCMDSLHADLIEFDKNLDTIRAGTDRAREDKVAWRKLQDRPRRLAKKAGAQALDILMRLKPLYEIHNTISCGTQTLQSLRDSL